jgi:hypothetical protein
MKLNVSWAETISLADLPTDLLEEIAAAAKANPQIRYDIHEGKITRIDLLKHILEWNGIIGFHTSIAKLVDELQGAESK